MIIITMTFPMNFQISWIVKFFSADIAKKGAFSRVCSQVIFQENSFDKTLSTNLTNVRLATHVWLATHVLVSGMNF